VSQSVILVAPRGWTIDSIADLFDAKVLRTSRSEDSNEFQIQDPAAGSYVNFSKFVEPTDEDIADDYYTNDDLEEEFRSSLANKTYFSVAFKGLDFAREAIRAVVMMAPVETWIDTDYGWVIRGDRVLDELQKNPAWDWRYSRK
jgi:hypothetical protein